MPKTYTVKAGDTLSSIAKANGTTVHALMTLNTFIKDKNVIRVGWVLTLPGSSPVTPAPAAPVTDYEAVGKQVETVLRDIQTLPSFAKLMELM